MRKISRLSLVLTGFLLVACSSTHWAHPNKPEEAFTTDYNKCQQDAFRDPKLQQGSQLLLINATERCIQKEGWRMIEREK